MCFCILLGPLRGRKSCCLSGFGSWSLVFHCGMPRQISPLSPTPSQTEVCSTMGESTRPSSFHNTTPSANKHVAQIYRSSLSAAVQTVQPGERRTSPFNGIERSLSRAVVIKTKSLPVSATVPRFQQRCLCTSHTMGESISTIKGSPRISTSHKFAAPRYRLPPMALQTVQLSVEPRLSTALKDRSVVPYSSPKVSARLRYHVSNSVVFLHRAETLAKGYPLFKLFSRAEPVPFEKEININLVHSSCLKHANEMLLGNPQQADQRTQSFHFPIVIHQSLTRPCCSIERFAKLLGLSCTSSTRQQLQAQNASTRMHYGPLPG